MHKKKLPRTPSAINADPNINLCEINKPKKHDHFPRCAQKSDSSSVCGPNVIMFQPKSMNCTDKSALFISRY